MSEVSDGKTSSNCAHCQAPFHSDSVRFCGNCGSPRFQTKRKICLLCGFLIPDKPECINCSAPQNEEIFDNTPLKICINKNPQCGAFLMPNSSKCYKCNALQQKHVIAEPDRALFELSTNNTSSKHIIPNSGESHENQQQQYHVTDSLSSQQATLGNQLSTFNNGAHSPTVAVKPSESDDNCTDSTQSDSTETIPLSSTQHGFTEMAAQSTLDLTETEASVTSTQSVVRFTIPVIDTEPNSTVTTVPPTEFSSVNKAVFSAPFAHDLSESIGANPEPSFEHENSTDCPLNVTTPEPTCNTQTLLFEDNETTPNNSNINDIVTTPASPTKFTSIDNSIVTTVPTTSTEDDSYATIVSPASTKDGIITTASSKIQSSTNNFSDDTHSVPPTQTKVLNIPDNEVEKQSVAVTSPIITEQTDQDSKEQIEVTGDVATRNDCSTESSETNEGEINRPTFLPDCPAALREMSGSMVTLVFHALLQPHIWDWNQESKVFIKFSHEGLGNWKHDCGPMIVVREIDNFIELKYEMEVNQDILNSNIQYKYNVYTPKTEYGSCSEHIYYGISQFANRVLKVSGGSCQHDTLIVPYVPKPISDDSKRPLEQIRKLGSRVLSSFWSPSKPIELDITNTSAIRKKCLEVYLIDELNMLQTGIMNTSAGDDFVKSIGEVYYCLCNVWIQDENMTDAKPWYYNLGEEMKHFLFSAVEQHKRNCNSTTCDAITIASALTICIFQKLQLKIQMKNIIDVLSLVVLHPDIQDQECLQFNALKVLINNNNNLRELFFNGIKIFCQELLHNRLAILTVWKVLFLTQRIHISQKKLQGTEDTPKYIQWIPSGNNQLFWELLKSMKTTNWKPKLSVETYNGLESWFKLDSQFLPHFIYCWSSRAYEYLFTVIDPFFSISRAALSLTSENNSEIVKRWLCSICKNITENGPSYSIIQVQKVLNATEYLMESLTASTHNHTPDVFLQSVSLVLQVYSLPVCSANDYLPEYSKLTFYLSVYVNMVIGGHQFGCKISNSSGKIQLEKSQKEFEMWDKILSLQCSDEVLKVWESAVEEVLFLRIQKLDSFEWKLEVLFKAEALKSVNQLVMSIIIKDVDKSLQSVICHPDFDISEESKMKMEKSDIMSTLLGNLLEVKYPNYDSQSNSITIEDILKWDFWPTIIKAYVRHQRITGLALEICHTAFSIVTGVCSSIQDGSVTIGILEIIKEKESSMEKLYAAISHGKKSVSTTDKDFSHSLHIYTEQYIIFMSQHSKLSMFMKQLPTTNISGLQKLQDDLAVDISGKPISSFCTTLEDGQMIIPSFQCAEPIFPILPKFITLSSKHPSKTFHNLLKAQIQKVKEQLKISNFAPLVWQPIFQDCCMYLESLKDRTIKLTLVDKLLDQHFDNELEFELCSLEKGICECSGIPSDPSWIKPCVKRMQQYRSLRQYASAAKAILQLKETLALTGNFDVIKKISTELEQSIHDQSLQFNDELMETGDFLREISSDRGKFSCLETFGHCKELIKWIKKETKDVHDLQQFITIALATASGGEDDYTRDALSNLRTVCRGFSNLIYHIPTHTGYKELQTYLRSLLDSLKYDPTLPDKLNDCGKQIEWYKSVKEMQGSVEKTSCGQMNNINKYGCYTVGSNDEASCSSLSKLICLNLQRCHKPGAQQKYTMDELRDLESKLVLIIGKESDEKEHYGKVFNTVCHIAEVLIQLQQHGHSQYVGWILRFPCNIQDIVDKLTEILKKMVSDLEVWQKMINEARQHFYCLNYYTTQQLLLLRKELHIISDPSSIKPDVVTLLQSISKKVTAELVFTILKEVNDENGKVEEEKWEELDDIQHEFLSFTDGAKQEGNRSEENVWEESMEAMELTKTTIGFTESTLPRPRYSVHQPDFQKIDLTDKQKGIIANLKAAFGFSTKLILVAFEKTSKPNVEEDVGNWCLNNEINYDFSDDEGSDFEPDQDMGHCDQQLEDTFHDEAQSIEEQVIPSCQLISKSTVCEYPVADLIHVLDSTPQPIEYEDITVESQYVATHTAGPLSTKLNKRIPSADVSGIEITYDKSTKTYLSLVTLAKLLSKLNKRVKADINSERSMHKMLKQGEPNLIVVASDQVLKTVLSLYIEGSLPTYEEVLVCNERTTTEEVTLLWKRAMGDSNYLRIFCLVHAELLPYQVCDKALKSLVQCSQGKTGYKIAIVCSDEDLDKSHIVSKLQGYRRPYCSIVYSDENFIQYLFNHFTTWPNSTGLKIKASDVDPNKSYVRVVTSERAGSGKSLFIENMKNELRRKYPQMSDAIIPVHGPKVTNDSIVESLTESFGGNKERSQAIIFHLDIASTVLRQVDCLLFSLLILQALSDSQGRVWRCHPAHYYAVEITILKKDEAFAQNTIALLNLLPTNSCISPRKMLEIRKKDMTIDTNQFQKEHFQCVYQYLKRHSTAQTLNLFNFRPGIIEGNPSDCLEVLLNNCGVKNPSWSELSNFVTFLGSQLKSCEQSIFCNETLALPGLKIFAVKFMIRMSKDFSTSSLKGEVSAENQESGSTDEIDELQIDKRKQWEANYHPYLFFNEDRISITFVGFKVTPNGNLEDPVKNTVIEYGVMKTDLYKSLQLNRVNLSENYQTWNKKEMIQKICTVMGLEKNADPDSTYVLTVDNVIKMMAIHMRFRCNIPVILMGETGCGKTRLIKYMCDLASINCQGQNQAQNMIIMKIHGGTSENDVIKKVKAAEEMAEKNRSTYTVLFFDEANTSDAIGLIKEVMCDRRVYGRSIRSDVKFIAACNPYRKHTEQMISKLESAGLGFFVKANETQQKLGKIPLRQLVYRVLDLPPSMRPLVYDFGQLNNATEKDYITQIVKNRCQQIPQVMGRLDVAQSIANVLDWSQKYMRRRNDECSFVSLRDVERAMIIFSYFCSKKDIFSGNINEKATIERQQPVDYLTRSLILTVSVSYHARLQNRSDFEDGIVQQFSAPLMQIGKMQFCNEIRWCQDVLLDNMKLGENIARNAALRENVFMMIICIELRIPLFLVGKPGSSKSLAKSIVAASMLGKASEKHLMRQMNEVQIFSYQCSQLSTSESVIEIFNTAKSFQSRQESSKFVSVVVLDEVGLAEDSPNLPLKALHPLLEDGTEGADGSGQVLSREQRVAFIGISNWALDPAKMNRGVMVTRGDPDETELELSARGICSNVQNDPVRDKLAPFFKPLSTAYKEICDLQERNKRLFFGLRDFYSLIKMLYWMCQSTGMELTGPQLQHAIKRNFGGLDSKDIDTEKIFRNHVKEFLDYVPNLYNITDEMQDILLPDCSPLGLIRKSLQTKDVTWHGENRYLLFLTENYAALQVLKHYLYEEVGMETTNETSFLEEPESSHHRTEPFFLFGSSFPKDREYTQVCRNINKIKICMETGRMVILLNLDNLYESLYDLLNQYYIQLGGQRYVDLGLQTHRVKCRVHNNFKLILIAEKRTVYSKFPIPLINRLEKHFVLTETILLKWQKEVYDKLMNWIKDFSEIRSDSKFSVQDAFVGYQNDTPASVVFQATQQLQKEWNWSKGVHESSEKWKNGVLARSKKILLQMASPDSMIRLKLTRLEKKRDKLLQIYYVDQQHGSMVGFLDYHLKSKPKNQAACLLQVTTHSHLLSSQEIIQLSNNLQLKESQVKCFLLQEFDTEMDFTHKISHVFSDDDESLLIIQCDSGHLYGDLVSCARYRIEDELEKVERCSPTHVLLMIHLPHQSADACTSTSLSFVGFPGGAWISAHIDGIRISYESDLTLEDAQSTPISHLFYSEMFHNETDVSDTNVTVILQQEKDEMDDDSIILVATCPAKSTKKHHIQCTRLYGCIQAAVAKFIETDEEYKRSTAYIVKLLLNSIPQSPTFPLNSNTFYGALVRHIKLLLLERENQWYEKEWVLDEALSARKLHSGGTFQNVLARRLDEIIVPIFSAILLFIDQYSNFSLIEQTSHKDHIKQLWMQIFSNEHLVQFSYQIYMTNKGIFHYDQEPGMTFKCQFPFFWLIKEAIDSNVEMIGFSFGSKNLVENHVQLCHMLSDNPVATVLRNLPDEYSVELCQFYLHDVIRSTHHVPHCLPKKEYQILNNALLAMINDASFHHTSAVSYLAAVHILLHEYQQDIMWFGQLTTIIPGILYQLPDEKYNNKQFELPLLAVRAAIGPDNLDIPLDPDGRQYIPERLVKLQLCQNIIDSILSLRLCTEMCYEIRLEWQRVKVIQLFIEHVAMKCSKNDESFIEFVQYAKRLDTKLGKQSNFAQQKPMSDMQDILKLLDKNSGKLLKYGSDMQDKIQRCSKSFFMEVVSSLCFGQSIPPEPDLINELLNVVFATEDNTTTRENAFPEETKDAKVSVIRSFLLQLLLELNDIVKDQLSDYFCRAQELVQNDSNLYLLCIQCLEDAIYKQNSQMSFARKIEQCHNTIQTGVELFNHHHKCQVQQQIGFEYLEGIAMLRYSFTIIAEIIYNLYQEGKIENIKCDLPLPLFTKAKTFLSQYPDSSSSGVFLAKQIARKYGITFLTKAINDPSMQWIIPASLYQSMKADQQISDPFVIYENYKKMKTTLIDAAYNKHTKALEANFETLPTSEVILLLLGIYQVVTGSTACTAEVDKIPDENRRRIMSAFRKISENRQLIEVAQHLIENTYCGRVEPMTIRPGMNPQNRLLTDLVVHVAIVMQHKCSVEILAPFIQMINTPRELKMKYLPTMPEDPLPSVRNAIIDGGQFYECPNGHPYFIGECGRPWTRSTCPECQSPIGGVGHKADDGNKIARNTDNTETGYALGQPKHRETIPSTERSLSPSACAIIRTLMHCSLLWSSCTNELNIQSLLDIINTEVRPADLSLFFWQHLKHDINMLSLSLGKSEDDACLLMHLILKQLSSVTGIGNLNSTLETREKRRDWEKSFFEKYIQPLILNLDIRLNEAITTLLNEKKEDKDRFLYVIHEREELPLEAITPHLWSYRSRITLEHLLQVLQTQKDTCPILHEFLIQEPILRATQYLPSIVTLQQQMYQLCHRKYNKKDVVELTIEAYTNKLRNKKSIRMFNENLNCLKKAWMLARGKLKNHARVSVDANLIDSVMWDENTPLSCLVPTLTGDGACTTALVDLLVGVHNEFMEKCQNEMKKKSKKDTHWRTHKIPISHVQCCHLLDYENQIIPLVLAHCQYSLEYGKGQKVEYDVPALEKHLVDRFIHGKPFLQLEILQVAYRKDVYTAEAFANIRKNVKPQKLLTRKQQADIVNELGSMQRLRECLDVVEIVIGFLSSNKSVASTELRTYIGRFLKMEKRFKSEKALQYCALGHVLSLWETLSVEMAKRLTLNGQEPFDAFSQVLLTELQDDQKEQLNSYLRGIELTPFLNLCYEFIETTVRHSEAQNTIDWFFRDVLFARLEQLGLDEILPHDFMDNFPETITVGQSVATWKAVVFYQQAHEQQV